MYTYRYSKEASTSISIYCPICRANQEVSIEGRIAIRYEHSISPSMLCCSEACTALYKKKLSRAYLWANESKSYRVDKCTTAQIDTEHYNSITVKDQIIKSRRHGSLASILAELLEYFPFATADTYKVK